MSTVTVEVSDLEKLIFGVGACVVPVEGQRLLAADPFAPDIPDLIAAHKKLAAKVREVKRAGSGTAVGWDEPLEDIELKVLWELERRLRLLLNPPAEPTPLQKFISWLRGKCKSTSNPDYYPFVVYGPNYQAYWPLAAKGCLEIKQRGEEFSIFLTRRGLEKLYFG